MSYLLGVLLIVLGAAWVIGCFVRDAKDYDPSVRLQVSYNSLTHGRSKYTVGEPPREFVLQGTVDGVLYRCRVSEDFFNAAEENSFLNVPESKCEEILP